MLRIIVLLILITTSIFGLTGNVVKVVDGDTIHVMTSTANTVKIRLENIDAPETGQEHSKESKIFLSNMVLNRSVSVNVTSTDFYGRSIGVVYLSSKNVNLEMVKYGHAWWFKAYSKDTNYQTLESTAKLNGYGLWSDPNPIPPWEYRKRK